MTNNGADSSTQTLPRPSADSSFGAFEYVFPAICGTQAGQDFFVSMCPLRLIPKVFLFDEDELVPELRAQRVLNKGRLPEMARYILDNPSSYVFSALTASVDGDLTFESSGLASHGDRMGLLRVPMTARFVINDGQHRRAAIELALKERPELADESIAIVFFHDADLARSQQMFADLNRHAIRPSPSIGVLYDHREEHAVIVREIVLSSPVFRDLTEMERSTLSPRSRKLFTLSAIYSATNALLRRIEADRNDKVTTARLFWEGCADSIPDWHAVRSRTAVAGEVRRECIHSHGTVLQALGNMGNCLLASGCTADELPDRLKPLSSIDWSRSNAGLWEGRALIGGRVSKASQNVILTTNVLLKAVDLPLPDENRQAEDAFKLGRAT